MIQAQKRGQAISLSRPIDAKAYDDYIITKIERNGTIQEIKSKLLIGADGAHSWTRRFFKLGRPKEMMVGFQVEVMDSEEKIIGSKCILVTMLLQVYSLGSFLRSWNASNRNLDSRTGSRRKEVEHYYHNLINHPLWKRNFKKSKK